MGTFEKLDFKQIVKTTEETITVDSDHGTFRLLSENDFPLIGIIINLCILAWFKLLLNLLL